MHDVNPTTNIEIDGYEFRHTPTETGCGGAGIYIREGYDFEIINDLSLSNTSVSESLFFELNRKGQKNLVIGCIYRHPAKISAFLDPFLKKTL